MFIESNILKAPINLRKNTRQLSKTSSCVKRERKVERDIGREILEEENSYQGS